MASIFSQTGTWYNTSTGKTISGKKPSGGNWISADPYTGKPILGTNVTPQGTSSPYAGMITNIAGIPGGAGYAATTPTTSQPMNLGSIFGNISPGQMTGQITGNYPQSTVTTPTQSAQPITQTGGQTGGYVPQTQTAGGVGGYTPTTGSYNQPIYSQYEVGNFDPYGNYEAQWQAAIDNARASGNEIVARYLEALPHGLGTPPRTYPSNSEMYKKITELGGKTQGLEIYSGATGIPELDATMKMMEDYMEQLIKNGQIINPDVTFTPEEIAGFVAQASQELDPYYAQQLKIATDNFLREIGYDVESLKLTQEQAEKQYQRNLRSLGEEMAESGFAYSGLRKEKERQLAEETQQAIQEKRRPLEYGAGSKAREFAQLWGTENVPGAELPGLPSITPGVETWLKTTANQPLYQLSTDIYGGLVGSKEKEKTLKTRELSDYYEEQKRKERGWEAWEALQGI